MDYITVRMNHLVLRAPEHWVFAPVTDEIWARTDTQIGILRIKYIGSLSKILNEKELTCRLRKFLNLVETHPVFDLRKPVGASYSFGGFSCFSNRNDRSLFIRGWYLSRDKRLATGAFVCPQKEHQSEAAIRELRECERIVLTTQFE